MTRTVAVFVGSLRKGSINRQYARVLEALARDRLSFEFVRIDDLPLYNDDLWNDGVAPDPVMRMKAQVAAAAGVLAAGQRSAPSGGDLLLVEGSEDLSRQQVGVQRSPGTHLYGGDRLGVIGPRHPAGDVSGGGTHGDTLSGGSPGCSTATAPATLRASPTTTAKMYSRSATGSRIAPSLVVVPVARAILPSR